MIRPLGSRAGSALAWRTTQHVGVNLVYLVRIPILAQLLSPDDFGLLAIALVALDVLLCLTDFGMVPALVQRETTEEQHYHVAWTVGLTRSLIVSAAVFIAAPIVASVFAEPRAIPVMRALAVRPLVQAAASIRVADLTRNLRFRSLAILYLMEALLNAGTSIAMAPFFGVWALVGGALAGPGAFAVASYFLAPYRPRLSIDRSAATSLIRFGRWMFAIGIIGLIGRFVLQAVISRRLGTPELGLYYLAAKIAYLPTKIADELIGAVAFPLYARLQYEPQRAARALRFVLTGMSASLLPIMGLLIVLAPSLVEDLLGARWLGTAPIIQVLAIATMIGLFGDAIDPVFKGLGQPYKVALLTAVQNALLVGLVWDMAGRYGLVGAAAAWLPATAVTQIVGVVLLRRLFARPFEGLGKALLYVTAVTIPGVTVAYWIDRFVPGIVGLAAAAVCGATLIAVLLWLVDRRTDLGLREIVTRMFPRLAALIGTSSGG